MLRLELRRAVFSPRFLLGAGLMLLWMMFNAAESVMGYERAVFAGVVQLLRLALDLHWSTGPVILAIAAIPYSFSYLTERECGFQQQAIERVGLRTYGVCKALATAISGFFMGMVAVGSFILILTAMGIPHTVRYDEVEYTYAVLVATRGPMWFYTVKLIQLGLVCAQAALFSLMAMAFIPNSYVGFLSPLIGYYMVDCIELLLTRIFPSNTFWTLFNMMYLFFDSGVNNNFFDSTAQNLIFTYLWTVGMLTVMALGFGCCFMWKLKKKAAQ